MARVQLALNVADLDEAVEYYSKLFATSPEKRRPGYANFAVADPPLKLVLFAGGEGAPLLNHLGVEVESSTEVTTAARRLAADGLATELEAETTCCHAIEDKVWVTGPGGHRWEIYTVLSDAGPDERTPCCGPA